MAVISESLVYSVGNIAFYSIFLTSLLSFLLRVFLNYYHFAYYSLHYIPRIVSTIGPYICYYQDWYFLILEIVTNRVIGFYIALSLFIIPFNKNWLLVLSIIGVSLFAILWNYNFGMIKSYLMGGLIVSIIVVTVIYGMWILYVNARMQLYI